jgi:hypothetical protein
MSKARDNINKLLRLMEDINSRTVPAPMKTARERADEAERAGATPHYRRRGAPYGDR